jgi:protein TonB
MSEHNNNNSLFNNWDNLAAPVRNDLVFENRNKSYGAYDLRRNQNKTLAISLSVTAIVFILIIGFPKILALLSNSQKEVEIPPIITNVDLTPPPPIDETEPPPPPPPPPPVMETVKFTPPVVTDEEVVDEPPPIQTEELPQISTSTQEGDGSNDIVIPESTGTGVVEAAPEEVFAVVEQMPEFPGGSEGLMKYLSNNIKYPSFEADNGITGRCVVTFVVEKDGSITDVRVLRGVNGGPGCDKEAIRVVKSMPSWKAGKQNGRSARVQYNLPINFSLK